MNQVDETAVLKPLLVARAEGPSGSFEAFYRSEHTRLFKALFLLTRNAHEAEDVMQQSFFKVWERWERVSVLENPSGYLYRTAMNEFRSKYRRAIRSAQRRWPRREGSDPLAEIETRDEVLRALAMITPRQRMALVLTEVLGYEAAEAAGILGIEPGSVRTLVSRAKARLARTREGD